MSNTRRLPPVKPATWNMPPIPEHRAGLAPDRLTGRCSPRVARRQTAANHPSTMKTEQIRHHFQVQVPNYSGLMQRLIPFYDTQRDVMLGLMPLDRDAPLRVLDLGVWARSIAARVLAEFARAELTLIDLTPEMIDESRSRLSAFDRV